MTVITEHNSKQEWEGHNSKGCWVSFFVGRHTVGVSDKLQWPDNIVHLEVSWWLDVVGSVTVSAPSLELSTWEGLNTSLDVGLFFNWAPDETKVVASLWLHHVKNSVDRFLLDNEVVHNLQLGAQNTISLSVDRLKILLETCFRLQQKVMVLFDLLVDISQFVEQSISKRSDLESGAHEGIADLANTVLKNSATLVDNQVDNLSDTLVGVEFLRELGQGLALGDTEEHARHSQHLVTSLDSSGDKAHLVVHVLEKEWLSLVLIHALGLNGGDAVRLLSNEGQHVGVVHLLVDVVLHVGDQLVLLIHELLLLSDLSLQGVEQHLLGLLLLLQQLVDLVNLLVNSLWTVDGNAVLSRHVDKEVEAALSLVAKLDARVVRQIENLLILVQVDEVGELHVTQ